MARTTSLEKAAAAKRFVRKKGVGARRRGNSWGGGLREETASWRRGGGAQSHPREWNAFWKRQFSAHH